MLAFLAALAYEIEGLKGTLKETRRQTGEAGPIFIGRYEGKEVLLGLTGMGREGAEAAVGWVIDRYAPQAIIATGFAAAINDGLKPGELVVCPGVFCSETAQSQSCDEGLLKRATAALGRAGAAFAWGNLLTVPHLVRGPWPPVKVDLAVKAMDMESYWIGRRAAEKGIPFLVVRSISDSLSHPLPPLDSLMDRQGRWHKGKALGYFLAHPGAVARMASLARDSSRARRSLTTFFRLFMEAWA